MVTLVGWIICGYVAGSLAMWLVPPSKPVPGLATIAYGVGGSIVGGIASSVMSGDPYSPAGFVWSTIGAVLVVLAANWYREAN